MCVRCPIECIVPPYVLDKMAESDDPKVRELAMETMQHSAAARAIRSMISSVPMFFASVAAPTAKKDRRIYDMKGMPPYASFLPGSLVRSEGDPKSSNDAVNEAYDYSGVTYDFYNKVFHRNSLDDRGLTLMSSVHAGKKFNNAFWNGQQMAYGDGDGKVFTRFTQALDVVGHELTHGVVSFTCSLEYRNESGALNEHLADAFGSMILQWRKKQTVSKASWLIGETIITPAPTRKAIRSMAAPGTAFKGDPYLGDDPQPAHIKNKFKGTDDNGGVHINSGIPNLAFTLVAKALGGYVWKKTGKIWYKAMLQATTTTNFQGFADLTYQIAKADYGATGAEQKAVKSAWGTVGITV